MKNNETISNPAEFTERFINQTNSPVFLTGKAGTGKTTLLRKIVETTHKNTVIVAPTGIAALNAGGVTIHSFFQLPFSSFIPEFVSEGLVNGNTKFESKETLKRHFHFNKTRQNLIRSVELLIIDEVSMLRADLLDAIDWTLRNVRRNNDPFGGVQVLFIGDLLQLPPVIKPEEWSLLKNYYHGIFFFNAHVFKEQAPVYIELDKIFRQDDQLFIDLLNHLRNNEITSEDQKLLEKYVNPQFDSTREEGYITLTTHNSKADQLNATALNSLSEKSVTYSAEIKGDFPPHLFPLEKDTELKVGAQIMFIKNDMSFEKNFYNGKMGVIKSLTSEEIEVFFKDEKRSIVVEKYEWNNIKYSLNEQSGEIEVGIHGTFVHYPIKLAWAITIHKSQGLTFDKAVLDVSQVFAPGQAYVALSRLRSLSGLVLLKPLSMNGLINDQQVVSYSSNNKAPEDTMKLFLDRETARFIYTSLFQAFDWYDYTTKWATFELGFKLQGPKTEKGKDKSWAANQLQTVQTTFDAARKFQNQLTNIFSKENPDWAFIHERVQAAYLYFFKPLDGQVYSIMKRRYELSKIKKTKSYHDELEELEQEVVGVVHRLMKARLLMEAVANQKPFTKETIKAPELTNYVIAKSHSIQQELRANRSMLDEMMEEEYTDVVQLVKEKKVKEEKVVKKDTYETTFELYEQGKTMEEIARERQLGVSTIEGHFVKLIRQEKIDITDILDPKRISEIEAYLEGTEGKSLGTIKDELGDKVTYGELKLVQASKML